MKHEICNMKYDTWLSLLLQNIILLYKNAGILFIFSIYLMNKQ